MGHTATQAGSGGLTATEHRLDNGLRLVHQMNLMTIGLYNEPAGAYLPSVLY